MSKRPDLHWNWTVFWLTALTQCALQWHAHQWVQGSIPMHTYLTHSLPQQNNCSPPLQIITIICNEALVGNHLWLFVMMMDGGCWHPMFLSFTFIHFLFICCVWVQVIQCHMRTRARQLLEYSQLFVIIFGVLWKLLYRLWIERTVNIITMQWWIRWVVLSGWVFVRQKITFRLMS